MIQKYFFVIFLIFFCIAFAHEEGQELKKIELQLLLKDFPQAFAEASEAIKKYPTSQAIEKVYLKTAIAMLSEKEVLPKLLAYQKKYVKDFSLLEDFAWTILEKGFASTQYNIRLSSLAGSMLTYDAKSVLFLVQALEDTSAIVRAGAAQLSRNCQDEILKEKMMERLQQEKIWWVRLELIRNMGFMNIFKGTEEILKIVDSCHATLEEKEAAWEALFALSLKIDIKRLKELFQSNRKELRILACRIAFLKDCYEVKDFLLSSIKDSSFEVRIAALDALTKDFFQNDTKKLFSALEDENDFVKIAAARLCFSFDAPRIEKMMRDWIVESPLEKVKRQAAYTLLKIGPKAIPLMVSLLKESKDSFVSVNIALALLGFQSHEKEACDVIFSFLQKEKGHLMVSFQNQLQQSFIIAPSTLRHVDTIPHYPETMDLYVRLRLASLLALHKDPRALEVIKTHLKALEGSLTRLSAMLLLQEGDRATFGFVKELLKDPDQNIRIEAALVLALFAKDSMAMPVLLESYSKASYMQKLEIIEAVSSIGDEESLDFFYRCFNEPFQILRTAAAAGLIHCLNQ